VADDLGSDSGRVVAMETPDGGAVIGGLTTEVDCEDVLECWMRRESLLDDPREAAHIRHERDVLVTDRDAALHRRAVIGARAPHAGLALGATPTTPTLTLSNDAIHVQLEQFLGLRLGAMKHIPHCTCRQGSRRTNLQDLANAHHALGCVKCNAGKAAHTAGIKHMARFINSNTACTAILEPHINPANLQRCDVRITTPEDDGKDLVVDYSTTCPTLHFESKQSTTQPATDFRGNLVSPLDIPLHAARQREKEKFTKYDRQARDRGWRFVPYVVQTSGGIGKAANTIIELIQKYAASVGCANPDGLALRFLTEQACIQAKCNAAMVDQVRRACRGLKPHAVRHDDDWLPVDRARAALRPYGRHGRPVATPT